MRFSALSAVTMAPMSQRVAHGKDESGEPLLTIAARRVGLRRAFRVLTFMAAWDRARRALDKRPIGLEDYREWWRETERTAYREQALFREAFPGESTPDRLLDLAYEQWVERQGVQGLGQVRLAL
jgi:hypothetical protein